jgi:hypothetical protein
MKTVLRACCVAVLLCLGAFSLSAQVPVSLSPTIRQQFFSASGTPLSGGFVSVYCAGTSTPCPTYLDSTGSSQATNPITLDSGGFASIWLPSTPVDIAVFNSSMTQQYKILNVTALPSEVTSLTATFFQSASTNPALSGFLRMASGDQICWRNNGNSADDCISKNSGDALLYTGTPFAFTGTEQIWTVPQIFTGLFFTGGTVFQSELTNSNTAQRIYNFPDSSGNVCLSGTVPCNLTAPVLTNPVINGVTISGPPSAVIADYDNYAPTQLFGLSAPATLQTATIPIGGVQSALPQGSFIEGETEFDSVSFTSTAPTIAIEVNGNSIGSFTLAASTTYEVRFSIALSSISSPQGLLSVISSTPAVVTTVATFPIPGGIITGTSPTVITTNMTAGNLVFLRQLFLHVRVRN